MALCQFFSRDRMFSYSSDGNTNSERNADCIAVNDQLINSIPAEDQFMQLSDDDEQLADISDTSHETGADNSTDEGRSKDKPPNAYKPFLSLPNNPCIFPLMQKVHISDDDDLLAAIERSIRFNASYEHLLADLKWNNMKRAYPSLPNTKSEIWTTLGRNDLNLVRHMYCNRCSKYLGIERKLKYRFTRTKRNCFGIEDMYDGAE